jgi:iron complex outermembrane receptor protein
MRNILFFLLLHCTSAHAQYADSIPVKNMEELVVTAYKEKPSEKTSMNIISLRIDSINRYSSYSISEMLSKIPGINMLTTGIGISKPVIRGLYGNRILILMSGLKFDNQQWQEEHGLGMSTIGFSKIELIKGPIGTLYGSEAIGGVINLLDNQKPALHSEETELTINFNSNTLGGIIKAEFEENKKGNWWSLRMGIENNADYSDGKNNRVLNSRFSNYTLKSTYGFEKNKFTSVNNFLSAYNKAGFIFNDVYSFVKPDNRWSRSLNKNPSHLVLLNILSSENKIQFHSGSLLNINLGVQSNERMENEGGGKVSLNMHLLTIQSLIKYELKLNDKNKMIVSSLHSFESNANFGSRKIIPDAKMQESNLSLYLETYLSKSLIFENGLGIGEKSIHTNLTESVNGPGKDIQPFKKFSPYYNLFSGITYFPNQHLNVKTNIATGVRIANLAELSSNGLHEGVFTYEIGNPNLKNEQLFSLNSFINYSNDYVECSLSPFINYFSNYIFLAPTTEQWFGFPVYRYQQNNVTQYGTEFSTSIKIKKQFQIKIDYSGMNSKTTNGKYTPYIPQQKLTPTLFYSLAKYKKASIRFFADLECSFTQTNTAPNEVNTPAYQLLNAGFSSDIYKKENKYSFSITFNNILNKAYYDHLSRFKYFGLLNPGRNISVNCNIKI